MSMIAGRSPAKRTAIRCVEYQGKKKHFGDLKKQSFPLFLAFLSVTRKFVEVDFMFRYFFFGDNLRKGNRTVDLLQGIQLVNEGALRTSGDWK